MTEFGAAAGAAALWLGAYAVIVAILRAGFTSSLASAALFAYPLFFGIQILLLKVLDLAGGLTTPAVIVAYVVFLVGGAATVYARRRHVRDLRTSAITAGSESQLVRMIAFGTAGVAVLALAFFSLIVPVHVWDVLAYHMPMVANYVQTGSLDPLFSQDPRHAFRVNGGELQMATLAFISRSDVWLELPNVLALAVALIAVYRLAERAHGSREIAYLCVVVTLTVPQILLGTGTAKNDVIFLALVLIAFYLTVRAALEADHGDPRLSLALGLVTSLAAATKVMGINLIGAVGLTLLILWLGKRVAFRQVLTFGAASIVLLFAFAGDIYWNNLKTSSVPVGLAPGEVQFTVGLENVFAAAKYYAYDLGFERLLAPQVYEHDFSHFGYLYPVLLLLGVAAIAQQAFVSRERRRAIAVLAVLCVILFVSVIAVRIPIRWDQRFMTWMVPAAAVLSAVWLRRASPSHVLALTSFCAALSVAALVAGLTNESDGLLLKSGKHAARTGHPARIVDVSPDRYDYRIEGFAELELRASEDDSILYVGGDDTWMYPAWGRRFTRRVAGVRDAGDLRDKLASGDYAVVLIEPEARPELRAMAEELAPGAGLGASLDANGRTIYMRKASSAKGPSE